MTYPLLQVHQELIEIAHLVIRVASKRLVKQLDPEEQAEEHLVRLSEVKNARHVMLVLNQFIAVENEHLMRTVYGITNNSERPLTVFTLARNIEPRDRLERVKIRRTIENTVISAVGALRYEILVARSLVLGNRNVAHESRA